MKRLNVLAVIGLLLAFAMLPMAPTTGQQASDAESNLSFDAFNLQSYWYSRYILSRSHARAGAGVHMLRGPMFGGDLDELQSTVKGFSKTTGHAVPTNPWPVFLEFKSARPFFSQSPDQSDFATLRWQRDSFDTTIDVGALGQAATKKIVWIEQFLRAVYDPPENRFIGFVLSGEVLSTFQWLMQNGTNTGEPLEPGNREGAYVPASFELQLESATGPDGNPRPPQIAGVSVKDPDSVLSDQWALLWATSEFMSLTDNSETQQYYDGDPFPPKASQLATNLAKTVFGNIQNRHWNGDVGTLVDRNHEGSERGTTVTTATVSRALNGIANVYKAFQGQELASQAERMIDRQASYLTQLQRENGRFPNAYDTTEGTVASSPTTLESQAAAIAGLLVAFDVTGNDNYRTAAFQGYQWMLDNLWDEENGVYRSARGTSTSTYTPWDVGSVLASHRNLLLKGDDLAGHRMVEFWHNVVNRSGMLQAELPQTGEAIGDGDPDTNDNGIPEPGKASAIEGAPHGVDAVLAHEVQLDGNSGEWDVTDRTFRTAAQMYAANEMYMTGIPTFAPPMVQALELRSITPESKVELANLDEARANHERIMRSIREPQPAQEQEQEEGQQQRRTQADQAPAEPAGRGIQALDGAVVRGGDATVFFNAEGEDGEKVCYANHSMDDGGFEVGCLNVPEAGETNRLETQAPSGETSGETSAESTSENEDASAQPDGKSLTVTASEFRFQPNQIEVEPGQDVTLTFTNDGQLEHNLTIPAMRAGTETIEAGATAELTFTAPSDESAYPIEFECTVAGHSEAGMVGEIVLD